jgi:hypothetical protein
MPIIGGRQIGVRGLGFQGAGRPSAPTSVAISNIKNASVQVSFNVPSSNGGSPITSYTVIASPGGITATGTSSPITISGLNPATSYTFTVTATNAAGTSIPSNPSSSVTTTNTYILSQTYNTSTTYTVPTGVNQISAFVFGGGANGNSGQSGSGNRGGAGGSGGISTRGVAFKDYSVTPGQTYSVIIGTGGSGESAFGSLSSASPNVSSSNVLGFITANSANAGAGAASFNTNVDGTTGNGKNAPNSGGNAASLNLSLTGLGSVTYQSGGGGGGGGGGALLAGCCGTYSGGNATSGGSGAGAGGRGGNTSGNATNQIQLGNAGTAGSNANNFGAGGGGGGGGGGARDGGGNGGAAGNGAAGRIFLYEY